jgi:hypothetical protein
MPEWPPAPPAPNRVPAHADEFPAEPPRGVEAPTSDLSHEGVAAAVLRGAANQINDIIAHIDSEIGQLEADIENLRARRASATSQREGVEAVAERLER